MLSKILTQFSLFNGMCFLQSVYVTALTLPSDQKDIGSTTYIFPYSFWYILPSITNFIYLVYKGYGSEIDF